MWTFFDWRKKFIGFELLFSRNSYKKFFKAYKFFNKNLYYQKVFRSKIYLSLKQFIYFNFINCFFYFNVKKSYFHNLLKLFLNQSVKYCKETQLLKKSFYLLKYLKKNNLYAKSAFALSPAFFKKIDFYINRKLDLGRDVWLDMELGLFNKINFYSTYLSYMIEINKFNKEKFQVHYDNLLKSRKLLFAFHNVLGFQEAKKYLLNQKKNIIKAYNTNIPSWRKHILFKETFSKLNDLVVLRVFYEKKNKVRSNKGPFRSSLFLTTLEKAYRSLIMQSYVEKYLYLDRIPTYSEFFQDISSLSFRNNPLPSTWDLMQWYEASFDRYLQRFDIFCNYCELLFLGLLESKKILEDTKIDNILEIKNYQESDYYKDSQNVPKLNGFLEFIEYLAFTRQYHIIKKWNSPWFKKRYILEKHRHKIIWKRKEKMFQYTEDFKTVKKDIIKSSRFLFWHSELNSFYTLTAQYFNPSLELYQSILYQHALSLWISDMLQNISWNTWYNSYCLNITILDIFYIEW